MPSLEDYKEEARLAMEHADYGSAIRSLTEALAIERDNISLYFTRGLAYFMRKDYDLAIEDLTTVLAVEHQNLDALLARAHAHFHTQEWNDALHDYSEYINIAGGKDNLPYERRAVVLTHLGDIETAIEDYSRVIEQGTDAGKHYFNRATLYYAMGEFQRTIADTTSAIEHQYPAPEVYATRGSAYAQLQEWNTALSDYSIAIDLDKRSASSYYNRGVVYYQTGQFDAAISDFSASLKIKADDVQTLYARAIAYMDNNDYHNARRDLSNLLRQQPENVVAYHKRGLVYRAQRKFDKAIDDFEKAVELAPMIPDYLLSQGEIEIELENYPGAIASLKRALLNLVNRQGIIYHRILAGLAVAYYLNTEDEQATSYYNQLLEQDLAYGDTKLWQSRFGWSNFLLNATQEMIEIIEAQDEG